MTIEEKIDDLLSRGVETFIDPQGKFKEKLLKKAKGDYAGSIVIKFGIDPTRPDIHLGHAVVLRKLKQFQDLGCKVVFLVGDFTAQIGDPTGKKKSRPEIDQQEAVRNVNSYISQIPKILKIEPTDEKEKKSVVRDPNGFVVESPWFGWMRNNEWFQGITDISTIGMDEDSPLLVDLSTRQKIKTPQNSFVEKAVVYTNTRMQEVYLKKKTIRTVTLINVLSFLRHISYTQLMERDMFQERIKKGEPLFMHEMLYPVFQGIDSEVIAEIYDSCDLEVGGTDQTFNMIMGRKVMEITKREPQAVISFEILVGLDGKEKMSKSLDNYVGITDAPNDMFGKIMSIPDKAISKYFELCTYTQLSKIKEIEKDLSLGKAHPKEVKMDLAQQIVEIYHGRDAATSAREVFISTFQKRETPEDLEGVEAEEGELLVDLLVREKILASKSEWRRLVEEGGAKTLKDNSEEKITNALVAAKAGVYKIGKRRFLRVK